MGGGFGESWRRRRRRSRVLAEVMRSIRAASAGDDRAQVRERIAAELDRRELTPPVTDHVSDIMTDSVLAGGDVMARARLGGRVMKDMAARAGAVSGVLLGHVTASGDNLSLPDAIMVRPDLGQPMLLVWPHPGTGRHDAEADRVVRALPGKREMLVLLGEARSGRVPVIIGAREAGLLSAADSQLFAAALDRGRAERRPVVAGSVRERLADGSERISLYRPAGW